MKIYIQARGSYDTLLNLSTWAEQNQIERIGLPDHYIVVNRDTIKTIQHLL